jgi:hypothetical protein
MYNGQISFLKNNFQHNANCKIETIEEDNLIHFNYENYDYKIPLYDLINNSYKSNTNIYFKVNDVIVNDLKLFILGVLNNKDRNIETNFLIYINNFDIQIIQDYGKWNISMPKLDKLIDIILYNNLNNYDQGEFANNISRNDLYKICEDVNIENPESLKTFLINILKWGDYDTVYSKQRGKPKGSDIISNHFNDNFHKDFIELFSESISINKIFNSFKNTNNKNTNLKKDLNKRLYIKHIGPAYFTKFLHFYSYGKNILPKMLILDKWSILAWATLMIEENNNDSEKNKLIKSLIYLDKKGKLNTKLTPTGKDYENFNKYIFTISNLHSIEANKFEELMFGWDLSEYKDGFINPRIHNNKIALNWLKNQKS